MHIRQKQTTPTKKNNHVCSHYWDNPMTTTNSVNFRTNSHPPQDHSENYPFFQQNKNTKQTPHHTDYLSSETTRHFCTICPRISHTRIATTSYI